MSSRRRSTRSYWKSALTICVAISAFIGTSGFLNPPSASAEPATEYQFNLATGKGWPNQFGTQAAQWLSDSIVINSLGAWEWPLAVTTSEMCRSDNPSAGQWADVAWTLEGYTNSTYAVDFNKQSIYRADRDPNCQQWGNGVFARANSPLSVWEQSQKQDYTVQGTDGTTHRSFVCVKPVLYIVPYMACATQITTNRDPQGKQENDEYKAYNDLKIAANGVYVLTGGDFNLSPSQLTGTHSWIACPCRSESDPILNTRTITVPYIGQGAPLLDKVDHFFGFGFARPFNANIWTPPIQTPTIYPVSDHYLLIAHFG